MGRSPHYKNTRALNYAHTISHNRFILAMWSRSKCQNAYFRLSLPVCRALKLGIGKLEKKTFIQLANSTLPPNTTCLIHCLRFTYFVMESKCWLHLLSVVQRIRLPQRHWDITTSIFSFVIGRIKPSRIICIRKSHQRESKTTVKLSEKNELTE